MINAAIVGCGHIHTPNFVKRLQAREDVLVKSVWDHDTERAQKCADQVGAAVASSPEEVWADGEVSATIICSETARHRELVLPGAQAGKHLFVEKPLATRPEEAFEMAEEIERAGVIFQTGYFMRGNPVNRFLREEIARGAFGKLTRLRVSVVHSGALRGMFDTEWRWMADPQQAGVGGFGDLGSHALDLLIWLLGDRSGVEAVTASLGSATHRYGDIDEYGEGLLRFDDATVGTIAAGWVDLANPVQLVVSGAEAHAHVLNGKLYYQRGQGSDGEQEWTELPAALPHAFELFLDAAAGKPDVPLVTPREAAIRGSVMAALYEGAVRRKWVSPQIAS